MKKLALRPGEVLDEFVTCSEIPDFAVGSNPVGSHIQIEDGENSGEISGEHMNLAEESENSRQSQPEASSASSGTLPFVIKMECKNSKGGVL